VHPFHPYQAEKLASQHRSDLRAASERSEYARLARLARQSGHARAHQGGRHVIRRRAGWALVSLGLRLAYAAGED
jgi:hypothetical protein